MNAGVAQLVECRTFNPMVAGSSPAVSICFFLKIQMMVPYIGAPVENDGTPAYVDFPRHFYYGKE